MSPDALRSHCFPTAQSPACEIARAFDKASSKLLCVDALLVVKHPAGIFSNPMGPGVGRDQLSNIALIFEGAARSVPQVLLDVLKVNVEPFFVQPMVPYRLGFKRPIRTRRTARSKSASRRHHREIFKEWCVGWAPRAGDRACVARGVIDAAEWLVLRRLPRAAHDWKNYTSKD